ncbi:MAG: glycoside hydrolase family 3 protein [Acidobacteria bacterium]|nr:glycoside hydrolase family 3 protein [Acidobacteriota bacterium]
MLEQIPDLSLQQKIGQLFFIGISGVEVDENLRELFREISPGGVCLFARNIRTAEQVRRLLTDIRDILPVEPLLSLDQEGGVVDRLRRISTPMPSASSIKIVEEARHLAEITTEVVRLLGFNMNFAPVVDAVDEKRRQFTNGLYSRTFGKSKDVIELAGSYLKTLQANGCLGCLKHFPGLGASEVDSHEELPIVNLTRKDLLENDLSPYRELFKTGQVHAVMVAHASFPAFDLQETDSDGKLLPSSLSYNFVTKLLREELGFTGLTITDDLEMGAIVKNYGIGKACVLAINAGEDMLAICADADAVRGGFQAVLEAVKNGEISEKRINQSLQKIAHLKTLAQPPLPFDAARLAVLSEKIAELNKKVNYSYGG